MPAEVPGTSRAQGFLGFSLGELACFLLADLLRSLAQWGKWKTPHPSIPTLNGITLRGDHTSLWTWGFGAARWGGVFTLLQCVVFGCSVGYRH